MLSTTLFTIGPYDICLWNIIIISIIIIGTYLLRKFIYKTLNKHLSEAFFEIEGRKIAWLRLLGQSTYLMAIYIAVMSLNYNNNHVRFSDFLDIKIITIGDFHLNFYHIVSILCVLLVSKIFINIIKLYIKRSFRLADEYNRGSEFVYVQITKYVVYIFTILIVFQILNINLTLLLTGSAALLVGVGLGLQDVFKDLISGIVLIIEGTIRVGDIVAIPDKGDSNSIVAKIIKVNVRTTQIETRDGNVLIISNSKLTQDTVENWSHGSEVTRFIINLSVAYGSDTELVKELLIKAAKKHPKVKNKDDIFVRLSNFGENGLEIELLFWADQSWLINNYKSEIRFEIDLLFRENNIRIPFPQRTLHYNPSNTNKDK